MRPPILDKMVRVERRGGTRSLGHATGWTLVLETWAGIQPLKGTDHSGATLSDNKVDTLIKTRWHPLLSDVLASAGWRIVYRGRMFAVSFVRNVDEQGQWLIFETSEGSRSGD